MKVHIVAVRQSKTARLKRVKKVAELTYCGLSPSKTKTDGAPTCLRCLTAHKEEHHVAR
jgi:ribosomal protein L7/L12